MRYEFAPSKGQIHAHILAIHDNPFVMKPYYESNKDKKKQEELLYQWMTKELGLTASFPKSCLDNTYDKNNHPSKNLYQDIIENKNEDFVSCLQKLQNYKCSAFYIQKCHVL